MSLVEHIINNSDMLYDLYGECGDRCNHPSGSCKSCGGCHECLRQIHFPNQLSSFSERTLYNCQKLTYYYACRYTWKYCSEIIYAFERMDWSKYNFYSVMSIGCGQSPDLMALEYINNKEKKRIDYHGIDINPYWSKLHDYVKSYCQHVSNMSCDYYVTDVISFMRMYKCPANIVVLSYVISSFAAFDRFIKVEQLADLIICQVLEYVEQRPVLILINDIDLEEITICFDVFLSKLNAKGFRYRYLKGHFKQRDKERDDGSGLYESNANKFLIKSDFRDKYKCAVWCSSAQCLIEVVK